ncbi:unnamed protein product [Symbiodinium natans]|uniref:Uncharacterized protein n=1 Tax=Symbiodinium natans TaxID=878477 RepID=A0A812J615_9DINO|nr:unnamed protein product [Symbiodinium natans]
MDDAPDGGWLPRDPNLPAGLHKDLLVALQKAASRAAPSPAEEEVVPVLPAQEAQRSSASSAPGRTQTMGRRTFRPGDAAFYWSATHRTWLKTCVLSVNRDGGGDKSETYNLDCKSRVESWQMRTADEPRDGPPDCSEGAGGGFAVGMPVQCFNQQKRVWENGTVVRRYQQDKIIVFDVECKESTVRMLPASRLRLSRFAVGDKVEYWSMTSKSWLLAKVLKLYWSKQTCDLDIKKGAPLANVRKVNESAESRSPAPGGGPKAAEPTPVPEDPADSRGALPRRRHTTSPSAGQPPKEEPPRSGMPPPPPPKRRRKKSMEPPPRGHEARDGVDSPDSKAVHELREGRKLREDRLKRRSGKEDGRDRRESRNGRSNWRDLPDVRDVRDR